MSTEDTYGALIDLPYIKEDMINVFAHMAGVDDALISPVPSTMIDGSKQVIPYQLTSEDKVPEISFYLGRFKRIFGLGDSETSLNSLIFTNVQSANTFTIPNISDYRQVRDLLSVQVTSISDFVKPEFKPHTIGIKQFYALPTNILAASSLETLFLNDVQEDSSKLSMAKSALDIRRKDLEKTLAKEAEAILTLGDLAPIYNLEGVLLEDALSVAKGEATLPPEEVILTFLGEEIGTIFIKASQMEASKLESILSIKKLYADLKVRIFVPTYSDTPAEFKNDYSDYIEYFKVPLTSLETALSEQGIAEDKVLKAKEALEFIYN
jgi:hypothetical protein